MKKPAQSGKNTPYTRKLKSVPAVPKAAKKGLKSGRGKKGK